MPTEPSRAARDQVARENAITVGTPGQINPPPAERPSDSFDTDATPTARHCWVIEDDGRRPGLLLDWRKLPDGQWEGFVVRQTTDGHAATWVRANQLAPADTPTPPPGG